VPEPTRSLEDLLEHFSRPAFVVYFSLLGSVSTSFQAIPDQRIFFSESRRASFSHHCACCF
jgi:hypothetical protein